MFLDKFMRRKNDVKQTGRYKRVNAYVMILKQIIENWFDVLRLYLYMSVLYIYIYKISLFLNFYVNSMKNIQKIFI